MHPDDKLYEATITNVPKSLAEIEYTVSRRCGCTETFKSLFFVEKDSTIDDISGYLESRLDDGEKITYVNTRFIQTILKKSK